MKKLFLLFLICLSFNAIYASETKKDSINEKVIISKFDTLDEAEKVDLLIFQDSIIKSQATVIDKTKAIPPKPEPHSKPIDWVVWAFALLSYLIVWWISKIPYLKTIENPIVQRFVSETSHFIKIVQVSCIALSVFIPMVIELGVFGSPMVSILNYVEVACLSIAGFALFTTKKQELQK